MRVAWSPPEKLTEFQNDLGRDYPKQYSTNNSTFAISEERILGTPVTDASARLSETACVFTKPVDVAEKSRPWLNPPEVRFGCDASRAWVRRQCCA